LVDEYREEEEDDLVLEAYELVLSTVVESALVDVAAAVSADADVVIFLLVAVECAERADDDEAGEAGEAGTKIPQVMLVAATFVGPQ
jgi:hypothetical protein